MIQTNHHTTITDSNCSLVGFPLDVDNVLELFQEPSVVFTNIVTSAWMVAAVVGWFPLVEVVLWSCVVVMVVEHSLSHLPVPESDSSGQSSQVCDFDSVLLHYLEHLLCVSVVFFQDLFLLNSGVVALV